MPEWLVVAPGFVLILVSTAVAISGLATRSSSLVSTASRLRYLGIAVLIVLPGLQLVLAGRVNGPQWGEIVLGLIVMAFGGLWIIGLTGIPKGPGA
jgi:predicted tellurium resistance membrane protein TerC